MKTPLLVGVVVAVHCVAVGSAVLIQGCRSTLSPKSEPVVATQTTEVKQPEAVPQVLPPVVAAPKAEQAPSFETTTYVVGNGDSLSVIAYKYGLKVPEVMALNTMTNPNKLRVGQKLLLPGKVNLGAPKRHVVKKPKAAAVEGEAAGTTGGGEEYNVEPGDSLSAIAVKFGTTVGAIKKANSMTSSALKAGQKLMIPGSVKKEEKTEPAAESTQAPATEPVTTEPSTGAPASVPADVTAPVSAPATPAVEPAAGAAAPGAAAPVAGNAAATQSYTVEPNDDLVKVSKMWGVSVEELKKLNGLSENALKPGQVLKIPVVE